MTNVFLLWHISHLLREAGVQHLAEDGTPLCDEQAGDDPKLLSVYSRRARAGQDHRGAAAAWLS